MSPVPVIRPKKVIQSLLLNRPLQLRLVLIAGCPRPGNRSQGHVTTRCNNGFVKKWWQNVGKFWIYHITCELMYCMLTWCKDAPVVGQVHLWNAHPLSQNYIDYMFWGLLGSEIYPNYSLGLTCNISSKNLTNLAVEA